MRWMPIEQAKKDPDSPILIWFDHDKDKYYDGESGRLTDYGANAESGDFMRGKGICVAIWQDGFNQNDGWESGDEYWVPGGWFAYLNGEATDYVANATHWMPLPAMPEKL